MELDAREALILSGHLDVAASGQPLPPEVVWTRLVETIRLHRMIGGLCQACGERAGPEGRCFRSAVAVEWCRQNPLPFTAVLPDDRPAAHGYPPEQ
ncbi:hypothetical protein [Plantactinospora endophytica]|uniref:Uncharacterized protein n=1 Tax=Plantactinospora endophytica TaxID=673535 RepID=A0ABQ4E4W3_9ACTN|nr:hypothetical protein [Plantactinospora endophytica]GIG89730.1 hypothetical protein Pen02_46660 [Plantactinospora endophytica]